MSDPATLTDLAAYWQPQIDQWKTSGQSQAKFCQAHDLPYPRFLYWRRKLEGDTRACRTTQDSGGFATVDYRPEVHSGLTLSLPNGLVLRGISADNVPVVRLLLEQL
jgi:hypothetical protein